MPRESRDCAEDSKILERASDLYAERPIEEEDIAELEALIRSEAKRRRMAFSSEREAVSPSRLEEVSPDDDTRNSKASPVQREYIREQELIAWALIIVILVIS